MSSTASQFPLLCDVDAAQSIALLSTAFSAHIQDALLTGTDGQEVLDFNLPYGDANIPLIKNELTVKFGGSVFKVRTPSTEVDDAASGVVYAVHCEALWYDLGAAVPLGQVTGETAHAVMTTALAGTGWSVGTVQPTSSIYFTVAAGSSPLAVLRAVPGVYGGELQFDNVNKLVHLYTVRGTQTELLYARGKNETQSGVSTDTTNFYTRVYPTGANGIDISTVNSGQTYLEDYSYYDSIGAPHLVRAIQVQNSDLTEPSDVYSWGQGQLAVYSQPAVSYVVGIAVLSGDVVPNLGDFVRVWDKQLNYNVDARISARDWYPLEPTSTTLTIDTTQTSLAEALANGGLPSGATVVTKTDTLAPATPVGLNLTPAYSLNTQGIREVTAVFVWDAVTTNEDGSPCVDLSYYQTQYLVDGGAWTPLGDGTETSVQLPLLHAVTSLETRVAAIDVHGNRSPWATITAAALEDTTPPNQPSSLSLNTTTVPLGILASWNGLDSVGNPQAADFSYLEIHLSTSAYPTGGPTMASLVDTLTSSVGGTSPLVNLDPTVTYYLTSVAVDKSGNRSAASTTVTGSPAQFDGPQYFAVESINAGSVSSGELLAYLTVSGRIQSAPSGTFPNVIIDAEGIHAYGLTGTEIFNFDIPSQSLTVSGGTFTASTIDGGTIVGGTLETAASGTRVMITGGLSDRIQLFYGSATTPAGIVQAFDFNDLYVGNPAIGAFLELNESAATLNSDSGDIVLSGQEVQISSPVNLQGNALNAVGQINNGGGNTTVDTDLEFTGTGNMLQYDSIDSRTGASHVAAYFNSSGVLAPQASSSQFKTAIKRLRGVDRLLELKPITFRYQGDKSKERVPGVLAEQAHELGLTDLVSYDSEGQPYAVHYNGITVAMLPILAEHRAQIEQLNDRISKLEAALKKTS